MVPRKGKNSKNKQKQKTVGKNLTAFFLLFQEMYCVLFRKKLSTFLSFCPFRGAIKNSHWFKAKDCLFAQILNKNFPRLGNLFFYLPPPPPSPK